MIYGKTDDLCIKAIGYGQEKIQMGQCILKRKQDTDSAFFFQICILFLYGRKFSHVFWGQSLKMQFKERIIDK